MYIYAYIFYVVVSWECFFFAHGLIEYESFLTRFIWSTDKTLNKYYSSR